MTKKVIDGLTRDKLINLCGIINNLSHAPVVKEEPIKVAPNSIIHTTIGVYPNGEYKTNGVADEHLADHRKYNLSMRPGRALIVDGVIEYRGGLTMEDLEKIIIDKKLGEIKVPKCTVPYH